VPELPGLATAAIGVTRNYLVVGLGARRLRWPTMALSPVLMVLRSLRCRKFP
jgi:hypothetical protein